MTNSSQFHLEFRVATPADTEAVQAACFRERTVEAVHDMLIRTERSRSMGVVVLVQGQIIGYGQLTLWARTAEISDLSVHESWQSKGIGTRLIFHLLEAARRYRKVVEIGAAQGNPRALALYRRLGFRDDRVITLKTDNGDEPIVYLTFDLTSSGSHTGDPSPSF